MADGRDQGDGSLGHGAGQGLVVEGPEILHRTAAPGDDQDVGPGDGPARRHGVEPPDRGGHLSGGGVALDHHRPHHHAAGPAVADAVQDIADHRAGRAGDHTDRGGHGGQAPFARGLEQPFGRQLLLEAFELCEQGADAGGLHRLDDNLVPRSGREGGDTPGDDHLQPLLGPDGQTAHAALPDHAVEGGLVVLDRQIDMAACVVCDLRQLSAQPHEAVGVLQRPLERERQLRNGIGLGVGCLDVGFAHSTTIAVRASRGKPALSGFPLRAT